MIDTSKDETIKTVVKDSVAKGDHVVIVLLEGSKNAQVSYIKNRIKAVAGLEIWVTLMNFLYSCLRWGTLLMPHGYAVFGGLKGVNGRGEEAQDRAGGPH